MYYFKANDIHEQKITMKNSILYTIYYTYCVALLQVGTLNYAFEQCLQYITWVAKAVLYNTAIVLRYNVSVYGIIFSFYTVLITIRVRIRNRIVYRIIIILKSTKCEPLHYCTVAPASLSLFTYIYIKIIL